MMSRQLNNGYVDVIYTNILHYLPMAVFFKIMKELEYDNILCCCLVSKNLFYNSDCSRLAVGRPF